MTGVNEIFKLLDAELHDGEQELHEIRATLKLLHARVLTDREVLLDALAFLVGILKATDGHMWHEWQATLRRVEGILSDAGKLPIAPPLAEPLP